MAINVQIPPLGESVTEAVLLRWMKDEGSSVNTDEPLCELETDKANVELPSPGAGVLKHMKKPGDTVKIGDVIARVEEKGASTQKAAPAKATPAPAPSKPVEAKMAAPVAPVAMAVDGKETRSVPPASSNDIPIDAPLSPSVRRLVREHQVDAEALSGTGPRGRVTKEDVLNYVEHSGTALPVPPPAQTLVSTPAPSTISRSDEPGTRREPMSKLRKKIAERLVMAQRC
jgi:pyruvate/2-oxoglutarate dehydrogenase complex dihydrolipoamide acyltransferase (E2) component